MALVDQIDIASVWTDSDIRGTNDIGTVIVSADLSYSGEQLSDIYTLIVSARSGGTGTVTVQATSKNNPYDGRVTASVAFDDTTPNTEVLPGTELIFDSSAVNLDEATIEVGVWQGSFDASGVGAGTPSAGLRHRVLNSGASPVADAKARLITQAQYIDKTGRVFAMVHPFALDAVEKTAGGGSDRVMPYAIAVSGVAGSGPSKTATITVDGIAVPSDYIQDLTTGVLQNGTNLKAVSPIYKYAFVDGDLKDVVFALDASCSNGDTANILIFPSRYVQIAEDVAGTPGTYGTADAVLTQSGQSAGVITSGSLAYYWSRILVPASASNESNPYPCNIALEASEGQDAGWTV